MRMTKIQIAEAFSSGEFEKCFNYISDRTIWHTPGEQHLTGKKEIEPFCKNVTAYF